ncbi:uncharacterized protein LTR77_004454 [Saxophila tyrrhenica]|uniref:SP-RING-type domain-containing protein n=1 Tax=Saxophila tyrrhenica TaxID=1690608 RepID=A0AAV9PFZ6_9PEZI|nr:hypothetical protein LTR77_004454 [Saxophila tyrrhenica]
MPGTGHTPKKRKTTNTPTTADDIAQANSTAQLFAGARQNRWMLQDQNMSLQWGGPSLHRPPHEQVQERSISNAQETPSGMATTPREKGNMDGLQTGQQASSTSTNTDNELMAGLFDFTVSENPTTVAPSFLVDYGTPATTASATHEPPPAQNRAMRTSFDVTATTAWQQPGLPSPALTERNIRSPAFANADTFLQTAGSSHAAPPPQRRGPGRPRKPGHPPPDFLHTMNGNPPRKAGPVPQHQRLPSQTNIQPRPATQTPPNVNPQSRSRTHPTLPEFVAHCKELKHVNMRFNLAQFRQECHDHGQTLSDIDQGRLILLSNAVEGTDWFYITLSQIVVLADDAKCLPQPANEVVYHTWRFLDTLLSNNSAVSQHVLAFLGRFPMSLVGLYASPDSVRYQRQLCEVVEFVKGLPHRFGQLAQDCKDRLAPPLVEEMYDALGSASCVMQSTIFRAITRMIWEPQPGVDLNNGIGELEKLHYHNQAFFFANARRNRQEMDAAINAMRQTFFAWNGHVKSMAQFTAYQAQLAPSQRSKAPKFVCPPQAVATFQATPSLSTIVEQLDGSGRPPQLPSVQSASHAMDSRPSPTQSMHPHNAANTRAAGMPTTNQRAAQRNTTPAQPSMTLASNSAAVHPWTIEYPPQLQPPNPRVYLFPHERDPPRAQPTEPDTTRSGLHQAHLRSPTLKPLHPFAGCNLYRYVTAYAVPPTKINPDLPVSRITFEATPEDVERTPAAVPSNIAGEPPNYSLDRTSQQYRLRCVAVPPNDFPDDQSSIEAETFWPDNLYIDFNEKMVESRRKLHHGRHAPADLTDRVYEGENELKIALARTSTDTHSFNYALSIEIVGIMSHDDIIAGLESRSISAADSLAAIKQSLSPGSDVDMDDDFAITSSSMVIPIFEPFSANRMVTTPVRGSGCLHRDCFDLEAFLSTRQRKAPDQPTVVDCWRCPICRKDVRPHTLVKDGFLEEVVQELTRQGKLDARAIVVEADGSWKVKAEVKTGVRSESMEREDLVGAGKKNGKEIEVIELD